MNIDNISIDQILVKIMTHENGIIESDMRRNGLAYKVSYGVSVVDLRNIGQTLAKDNRLAHALWNKGWRETRILAGFVADANKLTMSEVETWSADTDTVEMVEQLSFNLLVRVPFARNLIEKFCTSPETNLKALGFFTAGHLILKETEKIESSIETLINLAFAAVESTSGFERRALSFFLMRVLRRFPAFSSLIVLKQAEMLVSTNVHCRWIGSEIGIELANL